MDEIEQIEAIEKECQRLAKHCASATLGLKPMDLSTFPLQGFTKTRKSWDDVGIPTGVQIVFHYTKKANIESIQINNLLSQEEQRARGVVTAVIKDCYTL